MTTTRNGHRVLINLSTGLEDAECVTVALLVAGAALDRGKRVGIWLTKEAVRLALPGYGVGVACDGCPPLDRLLEQFREKGGQLLPCPICFNARSLDDAALAPNARLTGATPMWDWIGAGATVFSY
jgi:predicted peroxiredoxin